MRISPIVAGIASILLALPAVSAAPSVDVAHSLPPANCIIADEEFWAPRAIDNSSCEEDGEGDAAHQAQNLAKNNLCAGGFLTATPSGGPARTTQFTYRRLQAAATGIREDLGIGPRTTPEDRSPFQSGVYTTSDGAALGEGALVRYVGYLIEGHFTGAESVNCSRTSQANYDIHLAFVSAKPPLSLSTHQAEALECGSVTAEIIPRRRPDAWNVLGQMRKTSQGLRGSLAKIEGHDLRRPLRLTGQLFFDGSHEACRAGARVAGQPARASNWEIHPVYAIDVCRLSSMSSCRWDRDDVWIPLHTWLEN